MNCGVSGTGFQPVRLLAGIFVTANTPTDPTSRLTKIVFMTGIPVKQANSCPARRRWTHFECASRNSDQENAVPLEERQGRCAEFCAGGGREKFIALSGERENHDGDRRENKLVLRRNGRSGRNERDGRRAGFANAAPAILAATRRFRHGNSTAHRGRDRKGLGHDEQQAEGDGGELFHELREFTSWPEPQRASSNKSRGSC